MAPLRQRRLPRVCHHVLLTDEPGVECSSGETGAHVTFGRVPRTGHVTASEQRTWATSAGGGREDMSALSHSICDGRLGNERVQRRETRRVSDLLQPPYGVARKKGAVLRAGTLTRA